MGSETKTQSESPHWSESFVEHLRAVHFALAALSLAIIFTLLSGKQYNPQKAWSHAVEIRDLSENWESDMYHLFISQPAVKVLPDSIGVFITFSTVNLPPFEGNVSYNLDKKTLAQNDHWQSLSASNTRPVSIATFRSWWNELHKGFTAVIPWFLWQDLGDPKKIQEFNRPRRCSLMIDRANKGDYGHCDVHETAQIYIKPRTDEINRATGHVTFIECRPEVVPYCVYFVQAEFPASANDKTANPVADISYAEPANVLHINESIMQSLYPDWGSGDFQAAFPDLAKAAFPDLEAIPLKDLPDRLNDGSKGDQVIEAFGLKIAAADVTRWGMLLLLATQFYFWLHLHELTRRIKPSDAGWNVAWIGIYQQWLAFITVVVSACVLPIVAASLASFRFQLENHLRFQHAAAVSAIAVSLCLAASTALKLYRLRLGASHGN